MVHNSEPVLKPADTPQFSEAPPHYGEFKRVVKVFFGRPLPMIGFIILIILILMAIFAPWFAPYDPYKMDMALRLTPPSQEHFLGTDSLGRDTLSRIIFGSRSSLLVGIIAISISGIAGIILGLIAAYRGGFIYSVIMRATDTLMSIPMIILALIIASLLGGGLKNVIIALGIGMIPAPTRLMCGMAMSTMQNDYVLAGRAMGAGDFRMMFKHILPNAFPPLLVLLTVGIGAAILAEAGLSFLGVGINPPGAAWGSMVNDGYKYLIISPVLSLSPGIAIMLVVFSFNMVGDGLRDALDPRLRGLL